jgi:hypothetical protein
MGVGLILLAIFCVSWRSCIIKNDFIPFLLVTSAVMQMLKEELKNVSME